jgi:hypothetical protein
VRAASPVASKREIAPLKEFTTTSGIMFAFPGPVEKRLLAEYQRRIKKSASEADARALRSLLQGVPGARY